MGRREQTARKTRGFSFGNDAEGEQHRPLIDGRDTVILCAVAAPVGIAVGAIDALFGHTLLQLDAVREAHTQLLLPFLALAGAGIAWAYRRVGKNTVRGMGLVFDVGHGREGSIPLRLVPFSIVSTWLTHLFGGSAGREGVAVQLGATISHAAARWIPLRGSGHTLLVVGMAAGFAGLFRTPFTATVFALEVLTAGKLEYRALLPALIAALAASGVSGALGLSKFEVALAMPFPLDAPGIMRLLALGAVFGLAGGAFAWCLAQAKRLAARIANPVARIVAIGAALSVILLALWQGRYSGLGTNLIAASFADGASGIMPWDWALKAALTIVTLAAGFQGGEVTPLFSIGASLGVLLAPVAGLPVALTAALGYASVFGAATNTFLAPVLVGCEVFGFANLPAFFIAAAAAHLFNLSASIYPQSHSE